MQYLQGRDAGPAQAAWIGLSCIAPGGHTTLSASAQEKFYVVIEGALEITGVSPAGVSTTSVLGPLDSCRIAPGEARQLHNRSADPVRVLLVMAQPAVSSAPTPAAAPAAASAPAPASDG